MPATSQRFLLLQGPHGPFFQQLARLLQTSGAQVWRIGFNAGDAAFWRDKDRYIPFQSLAENYFNDFNPLLIAV